MMMSDDKVGGWVKKGQNHDDVILECPLREHPWRAGPNCGKFIIIIGIFQKV